jgi:hypothetical protein
MRILPYRDPKINGLETIDACVVSESYWLVSFSFWSGDAEGIAVGVDFCLSCFLRDLL